MFCIKDNNPGAFNLIEELANDRRWTLRDGEAKSDRSGKHSRRARSRLSLLLGKDSQAEKKVDEFLVTSREEDLTECDHILLYLNNDTWTRSPDDPEASAALAKVLMRAMVAGVHVLLAHEKPDAFQEDSRHPCEFKEFFETTPEQLRLKSLYAEIAVPLKGGEWRKASMVLLAKQFQKHTHQASDMSKALASTVRAARGLAADGRKGLMAKLQVSRRYQRRLHDVLGDDGRAAEVEEEDHSAVHEQLDAEGAVRRKSKGVSMHEVKIEMEGPLHEHVRSQRGSIVGEPSRSRQLSTAL